MFRFTIRDVLWLTVVVGMSVAWWNERRVAEIRYWEFFHSLVDEVSPLVKPTGKNLRIKGPKGKEIQIGTHDEW